MNKLEKIKVNKTYLRKIVKDRGLTIPRMNDICQTGYSTASITKHLRKNELPLDAAIQYSRFLDIPLCNVVYGDLETKKMAEESLRKVIALFELGNAFGLSERNVFAVMALLKKAYNNLRKD